MSQDGRQDSGGRCRATRAGDSTRPAPDGACVEVSRRVRGWRWRVRGGVHDRSGREGALAMGGGPAALLSPPCLRREKLAGMRRRHRSQPLGLVTP